MENLTRRDLLKGIGAVSGGAAVLGVMGCHAHADTTPPPPPAKPAENWVNAGNLPAMKTGDVQEGSLPKSAGIDAIYVRQVTDKDILAITGKCTHRGCTVGYDKPSDDYICPCHGAKFDSKGAVLNGPAHTPLATLQTKFDKDKNLLVLIPPPPPPPTGPLPM